MNLESSEKGYKNSLETFAWKQNEKFTKTHIQILLKLNN